MNDTNINNEVRFFGWPWRHEEVSSAYDRREVVRDLDTLFSLSYLQIVVAIGAELRRQGYKVELRNARAEMGALFLAENSNGRLALRYVHALGFSALDEQCMHRFMKRLQPRDDTKIMIATRTCIQPESLDIAEGMGVQFIDGFHLLDLLRERGIPDDEQWQCPSCGGMRYLKNNCVGSGFFALVCPNKRMKRCDVNPVWMNAPGPGGEFVTNAAELPHNMLSA